MCMSTYILGTAKSNLEFSRVPICKKTVSAFSIAGENRNGFFMKRTGKFAAPGLPLRPYILTLYSNL